MKRFAPSSSIRLVFLLCGAALCVGRARAANLYSYDLDSLVYMSSQIVEADIVGHGAVKGYPVVRAKVTAVHKGAFTVGQTISLTALDFFRIPQPAAQSLGQTKGLGVAAHVVLFLVKAEEAFLWNIPKQAAIYWPVASGVKLVQDNKVLDFVQFNNPGPYEAVTPEAFPKGRFPSVNDFRVQVRNSITRMNALKAKFALPPDAKDTSWLLELLRADKRGTGIFGRDHLAELACERLAKLGDPAVLTNALLLKADWFDTMSLASGLNTARGRDLLLRRIANPQEAKANRLRFADVLQEIVIHLPNGPSSGADDAKFLARVAQLARQQRTDPALCAALLEGLGASWSSSDSGNDLKTRALWGQALNILAQLHAEASSALLRFKIESLTAHAGLKVFRHLYPQTGPVLSLLQPADPTQYARPKGRSVLIEYQVETLEGNAQGWTPIVMLLNRQTGASYALPSRAFAPIEANFRQQPSSMNGSDEIAIPRSVPAGIYLIRYGFKRQGKVISTGHGFEAHL